MIPAVREPFNAWSHGLAAFVFVATGIFLWISNVLTLTHAVFYTSAAGLFAASARYHAVLQPRSVLRWRKIDHSMIFVLIAGTFTPFAFNFLSPMLASGSIAAMWIVAVTGVYIKVREIRLKRWLSTLIYLLMGWAGVILLPAVYGKAGASVVVLILLGGVFYSSGAVIYARKKPDPWPGTVGFHGIWHVFVVAGALAHAVALYLV